MSAIAAGTTETSAIESVLSLDDSYADHPGVARSSEWRRPSAHGAASDTVIEFYELTPLIFSTKFNRQEVPDSPFDELERRSKDEALSVVEQIRTTPVPIAHTVANRLDDLLQIAEEEEIQVAAEPLKTFAEFLRSQPGLTRPKIVLTPAGNVRAIWRDARHKHFTAEFLRNENVRFVVFASDPSQPKRIARLSGTVSTEGLLIALAPYKIASWIMQ